MKCFVYYNLTRKCWSIKAMEGERKGRVIGHAKYVDLSTVVWKVSEAGRQRVLRDKRKNVHAGAVGFLRYWIDLDGKRMGTPANTLHDHYDTNTDAVPDMVTYNPYKGPHFTDLDTGERVLYSRTAYMCPERRVYVYGRAG